MGRHKAGQRVISTIHALLGVRAFLRVVWWERALAQADDGEFQPMEAVRQQIETELGYYAVDTVLDVALWAKLRRVRWLDAVHHSVCLLGFGLYATVRSTLTVGDFLVGLFAVMHASTPVLNATWALMQFGMEDGTLGRFLKLLLKVLFFVARVLVWPGVWLMYARMRGVSAVEVASLLPKKCLVGTATMTTLMLVWFVGGLRGKGKRSSAARKKDA